MVDRSETGVPPTFPGARWLATHQATVDNVLAGTRMKRRVVSRGDRFYNRDHWPALRFCEAMLNWMRQYPGNTPVRKDVEAWVSYANSREVTDPYIVIAHTPKNLTPQLAHALVGGGCHEGWHTRDSRRSRLAVQEMWSIVQPRWRLCPDWSLRVHLLETMFNVIEDIKLERRGIERMPATREAMVALQEFIWAQEAAMRLGLHAQGGSDEDWFNPAQVFVDTFRDLGLGYNTATSRELMAARRHHQPEVVRLVTETLKAHLIDCINLGARDNLGFLRKTLDIVGALEAHATTLEPKDSHDNHSEPATAGDLRQRDDGEGGELGDRPGEMADGSGDGDAERGRGESGGDGNDGLLQSDERTDSSLDGSDGGTAEEGPSRSPDAPDLGEGDGGDPGASLDGEDAEGELDGDGASHGGSDTGAAPVEHTTAEEVLDSAGPDAIHTMDARTALSRGILKEGLRETQVRAGEAIWRPWDPSLDHAEFVSPSEEGKAVDQERARRLLDSVRRVIAQLRAKFRSLMRAKEMQDREHGLPRGIDLSERMLADTFIDMLEGEVPRRAYYDEDEAVDNSVAAVVSRDQSSSTKKIKYLLDQAMLAVAEPIENIGGQVMCFGWRVGARGEVNPEPDDAYARQYHRLFGVRYDVFKAFGERFANVRWRFVNTRASGGTPMADGIEFGLMALSERPEAHRILFMITDGRPPRSIIPIIRGQLRRAREAGITVVAVATGSESCPEATPKLPFPKPYVAQIDGIPLFDNWVYERRPQDLPGPLVTKLTQILDRTASKRGRRVRR